MNIGLVLSGGGSRGFAHLGALKAFSEIGIRPSFISGSSAGALIGAFYSAGFNPSEISQILLKKGIFGNLKFSFDKFGIFSLTKVEKLMMEYIPHNSFADLQIPLSVCATDIKRGEAVFFSNGELSKPVLASCAIPGFFTPVSIDGHKYIDGGVINNLPLEPLKDKVDFLIGIDLMPVEKTMPVKSGKDIIKKCILMAVGEQSKQKYHLLDLLIQPEKINRFQGLSLEKTDEMFNLGYQATMQHSDVLKNLVKSNTY